MSISAPTFDVLGVSVDSPNAPPNPHQRERPSNINIRTQRLSSPPADFALNHSIRPVAYPHHAAWSPPLLSVSNSTMEPIQSPGWSAGSRQPPPASSTVANSVLAHTPEYLPERVQGRDLAQRLAPGAEETDVDGELATRKRKRFAGVWDDVAGDLSLYIHCASTPARAPRRPSSRPGKRSSQASGAVSLQESRRSSQADKEEGQSEDHERKRRRFNTRSMTSADQCRSESEKV